MKIEDFAEISRVGRPCTSAPGSESSNRDALICRRANLIHDKPCSTCRNLKHEWSTSYISRNIVLGFCASIFQFAKQTSPVFVCQGKKVLIKNSKRCLSLNRSTLVTDCWWGRPLNLVDIRSPVLLKGNSYHDDGPCKYGGTEVWPAAQCLITRPCVTGRGR